MWRLLVSEMVGTALLLLGGLSVVIVMFGTGSPMERLVPGVVPRQVITGFLFGCVGASIALSSIGKESGAHINPAVTLGFWIMQKLPSRWCRRGMPRWRRTRIGSRDGIPYNCSRLPWPS